MKLCDILRNNKISSFSAIALSDCKVTKERLISGAPENCFAVVMSVPYPYFENKGASIASFARIFDYHRFFEKLGAELSEYVADKYGERYIKTFADHSPIDERDAALKCGLGVMGDNGLLVTEGYGAFVFIGEAVCSLTAEELENEGISVVCEKELRENAKKQCIHCGKCKKACPGQCIGGDKSRCVSAITQKKGHLSDIEIDIIKKSSYWWGCDRCAEVCPYFTLKGGEYPKEFTEGVLLSPAFEDIEKMSDEEYAKYPFSWRKKEVLKRNFEIFKKVEE